MSVSNAVFLLPATLLTIGMFHFVATLEEDLVAKWYFVTRQLVWEIFDRSKMIKYKFELPWKHILAMRAGIEENTRHGILEIELEKEPTFYYCDTNPRPGFHPRWVLLSEDFTGGHAITYRRHYLMFPPGVLDKHYEVLLHSHEQLFQLSLRPFPTLKSPYFGPPLLNEGVMMDNSHDAEETLSSQGQGLNESVCDNDVIYSLVKMGLEDEEIDDQVRVDNKFKMKKDS